MSTFNFSPLRFSLRCSLRCSLLSLTLIFAVISSAISNAATLSSTVDRTTLSINETLTLIVTADQQVDSSQLDLSSLNQDFQILGSSPRSSTSISTVNGQTSKVASTVWTITLAPKRQGKLKIPSFILNSTVSKAIAITVEDSQQAKSTNQPLQASVVASGTAIYPSQQLIVEVELSADSGVRDLSGSPLLINNAEVESLGQRTFQRMDNGVARQIVSLKYAVFAKPSALQSGQISIPIMTFTGLQGGQRSFFGNRGTQVVARTKQLDIPVLAAPDTNGKAWFPTEDVDIRSSWSADKSALAVGTPITRTITITTKGQIANAIPPLSHPDLPDALKSYKDQAQLDTKPGESGFTSTRTESEALVANASGVFTLPELELNWWNVKSKRWELATLPAETLTVSGEALSRETPPAQTFNEARVPVDAKTDWLWPSISAVLAMLCLFQTIVIFRLKKSPTPKPLENHVRADEANSWKALKKSLRSKDALEMRKSILLWARAALPQQSPLTLSLITKIADDDKLSNAIKNLEESLFKDKREFSGDSLIEPLSRLRSKLADEQLNSAVNSDLPPLYKTSIN